MTLLFDVLKEITEMSTSELIKNAKKYILVKPDEECSYYINIYGRIFFDLEIANTNSLITIGNIGINYNNNHIHHKKDELKTEEEFFQYSLLHDVGDLNYDNYVRMVKFQQRMISEMPLIKGKL